MESRAGRYLAGLCAAALGMCGGGWLVLTPFAFGYPDRGRETMTALATGGGLVVVSSVMLLCWALAWRRRLRIDGVLAPRQSRAAQRRTERRTERSAKRHARAERLVRVSRQRELETAPDPAQVLTDLRALLTPLLSVAEESVAIVPAREPAPAAAAKTPAERTSAETALAQTAVVAETAAVAEANREVQAPGHLRGTRSASFFALPKQAGPSGPEPEPGSEAGSLMPHSLMQGAELLMVGTGEEESW
jgi:hypothetical protein